MKKISNQLRFDLVYFFQLLSKIFDTTIAEIVFAICAFYPKKEIIELVLETTNEKDKTALISSIFEYENYTGHNCLLVALNFVMKCNDGNVLYPESPVIKDTEATVRHLIRLGDDKNLKMMDILNHTRKDGVTLFHLSSVFIPSLANTLLERKVNVKTVDRIFITLSFKVSYPFILVNLLFNSSLHR